MDPMIVWVLERGCYSDRHVWGIYATPEAAMAAWDTAYNQSKRYSWTWDEKYQTWDNDGDWDAAASVERYEVKS